MKNEYLEVEATPFASQRGSHFMVRPLYRSLNYNKASQRFNKRILTVLIRSIFVLLLFFIPFNSSGQTTIKEEIIIKTNEERKSQGDIDYLKVNPLLEKAALAKANHMLNQKYFDHIAPGGVKAWDFIENEGYDYKYAGENLAINYSSASEVIGAWMASKTHRNNILDEDFSEIGVAVVEGELEGENTLIIVQILGAEDK